MAKVPIGSPATAKKKETAASSVPRGRNLVVLCDGTGNELGGALADVESDIRISNVLKLYRIAEKCKRQLVYYTPGVGTVRSDERRVGKEWVSTFNFRGLP